MWDNNHDPVAIASAQIKSSPRLLFEIVHMRGDAAPPVLDAYRTSVRAALLADLGHRTIVKARVVFAVRHAAEVARLRGGHSRFAGLVPEQLPRVLMSFDDDDESALSNSRPSDSVEPASASDVATIDSTDRERARQQLLEALELQERAAANTGGRAALPDGESVEPVLGEIAKGLEARMAECVTSIRCMFFFFCPCLTQAGRFESRMPKQTTGSSTATCFKRRTRLTRFSTPVLARIFCSTRHALLRTTVFACFLPFVFFLSFGCDSVSTTYSSVKFVL